MGQRHQIYVVRKNKDNYSALGAFHHQWCYGMRAVTNATRACELITKNKMRYDKWEEFICQDSREIESLIKASFGVDLDGQVSMVHNEQEYLIDQETRAIKPELGDNNDGCTLIVIDEDNLEVRLGFFTPGHVEGTHGDKAKKNKIYSRDQYLEFYYSKDEQAQFTDKELILQRKYLSKTQVQQATQSDLNLAMGKKLRAVKKGAQDA